MKKIFFLIAAILHLNIPSLLAMELQTASPLSTIREEDAEGSPLSQLNFTNLFSALTLGETEIDNPFSFNSNDNSNSSPLTETESDHKIYSISYTQGKRNKMEDFFDLRIDKDKRFACFGVFDGHGKPIGKDVSEYLKNYLFENFLESTEKNIQKKISTSFLKTNKDILSDIEICDEGSTAITAFFFKGELFVANVGDSRAIIITNGIASPCSIDHTVKNADEKERISDILADKKEKISDTPKANKVVDAVVFNDDGLINNNTNFYIIPSRDFGDSDFEDYVKPDPEIFQATLIDSDECLILASDGLWDVIGNQEAANLIQKQNSLEEKSHILVEEALKKGSGDNITVIVIDIKKLMELFNNHE
jgi:serine/threonine protein phosphatase PrpC